MMTVLILATPAAVDLKRDCFLNIVSPEREYFESRIRFNLQQPQQEDTRQSKLLRRRHLQLPYDG